MGIFLVLGTWYLSSRARLFCLLPSPVELVVEVGELLQEPLVHLIIIIMMLMLMLILVQMMTLMLLMLLMMILLMIQSLIISI